jgi:hypothetical protein
MRSDRPRLTDLGGELLAYGTSTLMLTIPSST